MHPFIQFKRATPIILGLALACVALSRSLQAVSPPPDGGYANFTTAEGSNALLHLTSGAANTGLGWSSLFSVTTGRLNTGVGAGTLALNDGNYNTAVGAAALLRNTSGIENTANGTYALFANTTGSDNTVTGAFALVNNTTGNQNTAIGVDALGANIIGGDNTGMGVHALLSNTEGSGNTAMGVDALLSNGSGNTNTAIGRQALFSNTTGNFNVALGFQAGGMVTTANDVICIGTSIPGENIDNTCFIGNIRLVATQNADAIPVLVDSHNQLGTISSSRRFKKEIKAMESASEAILALKPVTFHYKSDKTDTPQFGLIAEDVAAVNPDLVVRDNKGEIYTVRYDAVNAMLLNEFLKEHRKVQELTKDFQATVAQLTARLDEQAAQIQKVSAQIEVHQRAPKTVLNNR